MGIEPETGVVISGAGTGIGQAVAQRMVAAGFGVIAVGRRQEPLDRLAASMGPQMDAVAADVATAAGCAAVADRVVSAGRRCAGLVTAAGGLAAGGSPEAALHGWVYDLARELGPHGGTANVVAPGFVPDTEFWAGRLTAETRRERAAQTLVGREGRPGEIASLIAWLLGPDGGWVTGQVLSPNGGVVLGR